LVLLRFKKIYAFCTDTKISAQRGRPDAASEHASEEILGSADGKFIFDSTIPALQNKTAAKAA